MHRYPLIYPACEVLGLEYTAELNLILNGYVGTYGFIQDKKIK